MTFTLTGRSEPERIAGVRVSERYFGMLGIAPLHGRLFLKEDEKSGAGAVVILGEGLWRRRFASDPGIVSQAIDLDGRSHVVVGILPGGASIPSGVEELWVPLIIGPEELRATGSHRLSVIAGMALGARASDVMQLVLDRGVKLALAGLLGAPPASIP